MNIDTYAVVRSLIDRNIAFDYADEFGEPGYELKEGGVFVIGDWWCHDRNCKHNEKYDDGSDRIKLHSVTSHWPRLFDALEEANVEIDFYDEWYITSDSSPSKAYRTKPDSYQWQPSLIFCDGHPNGYEYLTPDEGIEEWIAYMVNDPRKCIPSYVWSEAQLIEAGFTEFSCDYESGWFEGMDDNPNAITQLIKERNQDTALDIVFYWKEQSQFYMKFCAFTRPRIEMLIKEHGSASDVLNWAEDTSTDLLSEYDLTDQDFAKLCERAVMEEEENEADN